MKNTRTNQKGITLIALIITIIILIILAGVAINLSIGENGIINRAKQAKESYINAQEDEQIKISHVANKLDDLVDGPSNGENNEIEETITIDKIKPGDYIRYDSGSNGKILFRVLYPLSSKYGLQIISHDSVKSVSLNGSNWNEQKTKYNNAINILNEEAQLYKNDTYAIDARCVGSSPSNKNAENTTVVTYNRDYTGTEDVSGMKSGDTNYEEDYNAMVSANIHSIGKEYWLASRYTANVDDSYFFYINFVTTKGEFTSHNFNFLGVNTWSGLVQVQKWDSIGLRPCIKLKENLKIESGKGTQISPYELSL